MSSIRLFTLDGALRGDPAVDAWFAMPPDAMRALARRWFEEMRTCGEDVVELLHDGHPTACVGSLALGYVNAYNDHVNVGFFLGASLPDPSGILEGTGRFMRHVKIRPDVPFDHSALRALIAAAYRDIKGRVR